MYDQEHGRAPAIEIDKEGDEDGTQAGASCGEARPHNAPHVTLTNLEMLRWKEKKTLNNILTKLNSVTTEASFLTRLNWLSQKRMLMVSSVAPHTWMVEVGSSK